MLLKCALHDMVATLSCRIVGASRGMKLSSRSRGSLDDVLIKSVSVLASCVNDRWVMLASIMQV
jgi:hypothetical protein